MLRRCLLLSAVAIFAGGALPPEIVVTNCPAHFGGRFKGERESTGPYKLRSAHCIDAKGINSLTSPSMAPDGSGFAWLNRDEVAVADVKSGQTRTFATPLSNSGFQSLTGGEPPIGWSGDSKVVWAAKQEVAYPSHFPLSGLTLMRLARDGSTVPTSLKPFPAGPLDAVQWIRNSAMALVQVGTNGSYYRPPHADPAPELAMIDAAHGQVLDRLALSSLRSFNQRKAGFDARFSIAAATAVVAAGRIRSVVTIRNQDGDTWVRWIQGSPPIEVASPFGKERRNRLVLVPSGKQVLNTRELQPDGVQIICEAWSRNCPTVPPPKPRTGPLLELRDFDTGKVLWSISTTVKDFWNGDILEVSPDGHFALVSWPEKKGGVFQAALVDLNKGAVAQFFPLGVSGGEAGFTAKGNEVWTQLTNVISIYRRS